MNHISRIQDLELEYTLLIADLTEDMNRIEDPKHFVEKKQQFDKIIHFHKKMIEEIEDLNSWLYVFGSGRAL